VLIVGVFHMIYRRRFVRLTDNYEEGCKGLKRPGLWDFAFYFSFGLIVIEAVNIAGILTVFAFLILPASLSVIMARTWRAKLITGWIAGTIASFFGLLLSLHWDVPSAPVIILLLGVLLLLGYVLYKISGAVGKA